MSQIKFEPTWESLQANYQVPEWFRDAKFGIWAHWGPQCQPEKGDWYAREMYLPGNWKYDDHLKRFGHPSQRGFKDIIHEWKADKWDPDALLKLYKTAGAKYFVALANHHDNFDLWDSSHQPWNSVRLGPKKDLIGGWEKAARKHGLRFGVSVHAAHAFSWYEPSQGADPSGPLKGVPYDGKLTKADGKGTWWEGLDPQDLYEQRHEPAPGFMDIHSIHARWNWGNGIATPDKHYIDRFYNRTIELVDKHKPDLLYFDDTALPLWPISDAGLKVAAHFYNANTKWHGGKLEAVLNGKILTPEQRRAMVWDIERGQSPTIEPLPWQTDTCIGEWHYNRDVYDQKRYRSATNVIRSLADVVSKNGNLLLSVPIRGDGSIDDQEVRIVEEIGIWMKTHHEAIYGTRPWKVAGEGPGFASSKPLTAQGFNEGSGLGSSAEDMRFTKKGNTLYVIIFARPKGPIRVQSLGRASGLAEKAVRTVRVLGSKETVKWVQSDAALEIEGVQNGNDAATVLKVDF